MSFINNSRYKIMENIFYKIHPKEELDEIKSVILNNKYNLMEKVFKKKYPYLYLDIIKIEFPFKTKTFSQKLYHILNYDIDKWKIGLCNTCGKRCTYINFYDGYYNYCSSKCSANNKLTREKYKQSNIAKYGTEHPYQSKICKDKYRQTNLEKYGVDNYAKTKECKDRIKKTNLDRHGDENYNNRELYRQTNLEKYGVDNYAKTKECKDRIKQTKSEKYNDENYNNIELAKQTCLKKYNVDSYTKTEECKEKIKHTNLKKYNSQFYFLSESYKKSNIEKYGIEIPSKLPIFTEKQKQTNLKKYGVEYYTQSEEYKQRQYNTKKKNNTFNTSNIERELTNWLVENNYNFIRQYKSELYPFACDFYLVDYNLYIEIQGTWTHGFHPFDANDINDIEQLNLWKEKNTPYYDTAIKVWSKKDVLKRNIAKENNLNYLEIFSTNLNMCIEIINNYINNIDYDKSKHTS